MRKLLISAFLLAGTTMGAMPIHAQTALEGRVGRLESEMRAVQRKVFPGGGGLVEPQIKPETTPTDLPGTPATSPVADLQVRVNALETRLSMFTGQVETLQHNLQLEQDQRRALDTRIKALEDASRGTATVAAPTPLLPPAATTPAKPAPTKAVPPRTGALTPPAVDPARDKKVSAIERPQTGDTAEDTYLYGYRLWQAKLYPEAEAQFKLVTTTYPKHKRASYAQNLLGRSYLEEGKPSLASLAFYDNYKKWPDGDRAPDSLFYLAQALVKLGKPAGDVCKVYRELTDVYSAKITETMKAGIERGRAESKCS